MATSQSIELDITDLAYGGDGVGRTDGRACFVPFPQTAHIECLTKLDSIVDP